MSDEKPQHSLADLVATAISPTLIVALIGSLVFFLLEVLYVGEYSGRMQWALFFYVFGSVLIGRIAMSGVIAGRSGLYALILGVLTWISLQAFMEYPSDSPLARTGWAINLGLVVLIWWCAKRLTWDCTYLDEGIDGSGAGVLESAGLDRDAPGEKLAVLSDEAPGKKLETTGLLGWWDRYQRYRDERRKRPHTPGVWVVYFSLAALPLFGLGQALIPAEADDRRRYAFWLLVLYTGSGLGLLLTTCFLGLRRYLRQRGMQMPAAMTGLWLTVGGIIIACLLVVGALLPRPQAEYAPLGAVSRMGSPERGASKKSVLHGRAAGEGDSSTPGEGRTAEPDGRSNGDSDKRTDPGNAQGQPRGQGQSGEKSGDRGNRDDRGGQRNGNSSGGSGSSQQNSSADRQTGRQDQGRDEKTQDSKADQGKNGDSSSQPNSSSNNPLAAALSALGPVGAVLKWIAIAIVVVLIVVAVCRAALQFLANFTGWAGRLLKGLHTWWQGLFGWFNRQKSKGSTDAAPPVEEKPLPFAAFSNPFHDDSAGRRAPAELVRYTFEAFQAWAVESDLSRRTDETASEFAERVGNDVPTLEEDALRLVGLYVRAAYATGTLPANALDILAQFWEHLEAAVERPLSA